jgi:uncharacterized membrane protein
MDPNLMMYAASYDDAETAKSDLQMLRDAQPRDDFTVVGAVLAMRDANGNVELKEHGATQTTGGALIGGTAGIVVGLFAPPLLLATAVGAAIGAGIGELTKRHEEKKLGVDIEEYLPPGSSAVLVVADDQYEDAIDKALAKATKKVTKAIDADDYAKLSRALEDAGYDVPRVVET